MPHYCRTLCFRHWVPLASCDQAILPRSRRTACLPHSHPPRRPTLPSRRHLRTESGRTPRPMASTLSHASTTSSKTSRSTACAVSTDIDCRWAVHPRVAVRPEEFGALLYHFGTRRLTFLKDRRLL